MDNTIKVFVPGYASFGACLWHDIWVQWCPEAKEEVVTIVTRGSEYEGDEDDEVVLDVINLDNVVAWVQATASIKGIGHQEVQLILDAKIISFPWGS